MKNIIRKSEVSNYRVAQDLRKKLALTINLLDIESALDDYTIYANEEKPMKYSSWWRLTVPLFVLFVIVLLLTYLPIHWIFTGHYRFSSKSKFADYCEKWMDRIWERR